MKSMSTHFISCIVALLLCCSFAALGQESAKLPLEVNTKNVFDAAYVEKSGAWWDNTMHTKFKSDNYVIVHVGDTPGQLDLYGVGTTVKTQLIISEAGEDKQFAETKRFDVAVKISNENFSMPLSRTTRYVKIQYKKCSFLGMGGIGDIDNIVIRKSIQVSKEKPLETDMFTPVTQTFHIKAYSIDGDLELNANNPKFTLSKTTITRDQAIAGTDISVTFTPETDGTEIVEITATDKADAGNADTYQWSTVVTTPEAEYTTSATQLSYLITAGELVNAIQEFSVNGTFIRTPFEIVAPDGFLIRQKGNDTFVQSIPVTPVAGVFNVSLEIECTALNRGVFPLNIGNISVELVINQTPTLSFGTSAIGKVYGDDLFAIPTTESDSPAEISYTIQDTAVAVIENGQIRILTAGSTTLTAIQGANDGFTEVSASIPFVIEKAELTIIAKDAERHIEEENPVFEIEYAGFVNGEDESVLLALPTVSCESEIETEGEYALIPSGAEAANYKFNYINGTLKVNGVVTGCRQASADKNLFFVNDGILLCHTNEIIEQVSLYNNQGQLVKQAVKPTGNQVSVSDLPAGIYIVYAKTAQGEIRCTIYK